MKSLFLTKIAIIDIPIDMESYFEKYMTKLLGSDIYIERENGLSVIYAPIFKKKKYKSIVDNNACKINLKCCSSTVKIIS